MENLRLDERIEAHVIGIESHPFLLAIGTSFSEGFKYFGTVFTEAEARAMPGPQAIDLDAEYLAAMREIYNLNMPPCRLMVGCSSES